MELLDEIWHFIFTVHLGLVETVRCRRVSKRFKSLVDQLHPTELLVYDHWPSSYAASYHRDDRSYWIQLYRFELESNSSFQIVFANLRVLELDISLKKLSSDPQRVQPPREALPEHGGHLQESNPATAQPPGVLHRALLEGRIQENSSKTGKHRLQQTASSGARLAGEEAAL